MKFVGYLVVGPNEKRLSEALRDIDWCDTTCVCLNNADEASVALCESLGVKIYHDNREWGKEQWKIKQEFFNRLVNEGIVKAGDWIIAKDADEIFDNLDRAKAEELAKKGGAGYYVYIVNLYNEGYSKVQSFWNVRMWQYQPSWNNTWTKRNLHCGLAPTHIYRWANFAPIILWHYGLKDKEDRDRKVARYKKYDPQNKWMRMNDSYYKFLASDAPVTELDNDLLNRVENFANKTNHKLVKERNMNKEKIHYVRRHWDGSLIPVPEHQLAEHLKRKQGGEKMFEYVGEVEASSGVEAPVEAPVETPIEPVKKKHTTSEDLTKSMTKKEMPKDLKTTAGQLSEEKKEITSTKPSYKKSKKKDQRLY